MSTNTRLPAPPPKSLSVFELEARCPDIIEEVRRSRRSVLITRRGRPVAEVSPFPRGRKERGRKSLRPKRSERELSWFSGPSTLPPEDEQPP
jgi:antitoxin (DNA-binding transcriptional repressor) of toxin-antitoxin stability system